MSLMMYIFLGVVALLFIAAMAVCVLNSFTTPNVPINPKEVDAQIIRFLDTIAHTSANPTVCPEEPIRIAESSEKPNAPLLKMEGNVNTCNVSHKSYEPTFHEMAIRVIPGKEQHLRHVVF
ncbi:uncharacterized protein LOC143223106 isoform X1 [Tachypleus tridentatus]|uniref:uncharacterized protein LOC143223106 isoform X1 n=1 Tax=Tachypleus tridentatus TaxID=6853 RepID=UPI003FCFC255